jgi:ParB-like chromosome segregation protein Spo0J
MLQNSEGRPLPPARVRVRAEKAPGRLGPVEQRPVAALRAYDGNPRKHPKGQIDKIATSIRTFGFLAPVLVTRDGLIIVGEARVAAARQAGLAEVPTIAIEHLSDTQIRAYRLADNRLAEGAVWDEKALAIEFDEIRLAGFGAIEILGWETGEIDLLEGASA